MLLTFAGFSGIATLTFLFSFYPRCYIRVFVPREDLRSAIRAVLHDPQFAVGMRLMAALQLGMGVIFGIIGLYMLFG